MEAIGLPEYPGNVSEPKGVPPSVPIDSNHGKNVLTWVHGEEQQGEAYDAHKQ